MSEQVTPAFTPPPALSPEATRAADWLRDLSRVARTSRLYSSSNSVIETAREEFARKTGEGVEEGGGWASQTLPEEILFGEELIVRLPRRGPTRGATAQRLLSELPFRLYRDGVRELSLLPGIPRRDVDALVDAVALAWTDRNRADDVVTSLWQSNPTHIRVEAAPPEQVLYVATGVGAEGLASRGVGLGLGLPPRATRMTGDPARADLALLEALAHVSKSELGEKLDASSSDDLAAFFRLVIALESPGVPLALIALGTSRPARQRASAAATLTHLCAADPALLAPRLDDPRPEFVQAIVKILGHIR